ncbi:Charged multivesicular body protein 6 [Chamberlinius hualienensis]
MGGLFGKTKKKQTRISEQDKAILQLKQQRDKLKQYQRKITESLEKERALAKKLIQENKKERAKLLLRKKKYQEQILQRTDGQLETIEKMVSDIEFAVIETKVLEGLKNGNTALKQLHDVMSLDEIEKILDETQESVAKQKEIDELLAGVLTSEDEDDVLEELDSLIKENMPEVPENMEVELPEVPEDEIGRKEKAEKVHQKVLVAAS